MIPTAASDASCCHCGRSFARDAALGLCPACVWSGIALDAAQDLALPGLEIVEEIARGGMGVVYRALEAGAGREVAVKMLLPALADEPGMRERFAQEARAVGALDHPGILPIHRIGECDGLPFFTMKLATGGTLAEKRDQLRGEWRAIAELMASVATAVHHAHQHGLLHRDLKPANILFDESGRAFVSDFGLVKIAGAKHDLTHSIAVLGTPHYLAPEVANRDARVASVASDVWSLGAMLYELLAGRPPFLAEGIPALLRQIVEDEPPPLSRRGKGNGTHGEADNTGAPPRDLGTIALKCLAKSPAARYASAQALADDLRAWVAGRPIAARPPKPLERAAASMRRNPALAAVTAALICAVGIGFFATWRKARALDEALTAALAQARAQHRAGKPGQRQETLDALARIGGLRPSSEVREAAITALALPDVRELRRLPLVDGRAPLLDGDFKKFLALESDGVLRIRAVADGAEVAVIPAPDPRIRAPRAFSADGRIAIVETANAALTPWDAGRQAWLAPLPGGARAAVISPDNARVAFATRGGDRVFVRGFKDGEETSIHAGLRGIEPLAWSPDGTRLALGRGAGHEHEVKIVDAATGAVERTLDHSPESRIRSVSWRPRGNGLAVTGGWFDARLWNFDLAPPQVARLHGHAVIVDAIACSPDDSLIVTAARDWTVRLWDAATREPLLAWAGSSELAAFSRDGSRLVYQHRGLGDLVVCEITPSEVCRLIRTPAPIDSDGIYGAYAVEFSPDGKRLVVADWGGAYYYEATTGQAAGRIDSGYARTALFTNDGALYLGADGLGRWRVGESRPDWTATTGGKFLRLAASADGSVLAGSLRDAIHIFDAKNREPVRTFAAPTGVEFNPIALSPDGRTLVATSATSGPARVWDVASGALRSEIAVTGPYAYAVFAPDGRTLWLQDQLELRQLDTTTLATLRRLPRADPGSGYGLLAISGDGRVIAAALDVHSVTLIDTTTARIRARIVHPRPRRIQWIALSRDASRMAVCTAGHVVQLWDLRALETRLHELGLDPVR